MKKYTIRYKKKDCDSTGEICHVMERKGIYIGLVAQNRFEELKYLFNRDTYVTLKRWSWKYPPTSSIDYDVNLTIEQPRKTFLGIIKRKIKLPKELTDILNSFNFEKEFNI